MTLKYRSIISKLNPMGTSMSNQIHLFWISRFGTLKVFDWKPKSVNNASKGYEFILNLPVNLLLCYFPYIFIPELHHSSRGKEKKNIICTNKTSLISKNNLWQVWCIWACSSTEGRLDIDSNVFSISFPFIWKKIDLLYPRLRCWNWLKLTKKFWRRRF